MKIINCLWKKSQNLSDGHKKNNDKINLVNQWQDNNAKFTGLPGKYSKIHL